MKSKSARAGLAVADQILYSLTNFVLTLLVAHVSSNIVFGQYAILLASYLIAIAAMRGLTAEPLVIKFSAGGQTRGAKKAAAACVGATLAFSIVLGCGCVALGIFAFSGEFGKLLIVFAAAFPGVAAQDCFRFVALAFGRPANALLADGSVVILQFTAMFVLLASHRATPTTLVACWGFAEYVGLLIAALSLRVMPDMRRVLQWISDQRGLAFRYASDNLTAQLTLQANTYVVAAAAGLASAGSLRAAQTAFAPFVVITLGIQTASIPEFVRLLEESITRMRRYVTIVSLGLGGMGLLWGLSTLVLPSHLGSLLFGSTWHAARPLLPYLIIVQVCNGVRIGPVVGLRALAAAQRTVRARIIVTFVTLAITVYGGIAGGALGAVVGMAIAGPIQVAVWAIEFRWARREKQHERAVDRINTRWAALAAEIGVVRSTEFGFHASNLPSESSPPPRKPT